MFRICRLWSSADACSSSPYTECVQAAARHRLGLSLIEVDIVRYQFITRAAVYALSALTHQMLLLMLYVNISVHMHYIAAVRILNTNKHGRDAGPKNGGIGWNKPICRVSGLIGLIFFHAVSSYCTLPRLSLRPAQQ